MGPSVAKMHSNLDFLDSVDVGVYSLVKSSKNNFLMLLLSRSQLNNEMRENYIHHDMMVVGGAHIYFMKDILS